MAAKKGERSRRGDRPVHVSVAQARGAEKPPASRRRKRQEMQQGEGWTKRTYRSVDERRNEMIDREARYELY